MLLIFLLFIGTASAQISMPYTALTRALDTGSSTVVFLESTGCLTNPALPTSPSKIGTPVLPPALSLLYIDQEAMRVNLITSTTQVQVERAVEGTSIASHSAGALVWCGPASYFGINDPAGVCSLPQIPVLPLVVIPSDSVWDCISGRWTRFTFGRSGSGVLSFPAIPDGATSSLTFALPGAVSGTTVLPGFPSTLEAGLVGMMRVSATNVVRVTLANLSGASVTPASQTFRATVQYGAPRTATLTFGSIADGDVSVQTFTLTGATAGDYVTPGFPATLPTGVFGAMRVSATNTVEVRLANLSGAAVTVGALAYRASVGATAPVGTGSGSLTYSAISDGNVGSQTFTVTGTAGHQVAPGWPSTLETGLIGTMLMSATNTVQARLADLSGGTVTPAVQTFKAATF